MDGFKLKLLEQRLMGSTSITSDELDTLVLPMINVRRRYLTNYEYSMPHLLNGRGARIRKMLNTHIDKLGDTTWSIPQSTFKAILVSKHLKINKYSTEGLIPFKDSHG